MLKMKVIRPNTIGITTSADFDNYTQFELWLEGKCERLADKGWQLSELSDSDSKHGTIEATHNNEADILLITWETYAE